MAGNRLEDLAELSAKVDVGLACGENLYGADEFARYVTSGVVAVIQPDLAKSGGFTIAREVARGLPEGVGMAPHCYGGALVTAASVQMAAVCDRVPYIELDARPNPLRDEILVEPLTPVDGRIAVPDGPGLGVELDRDALERFVVERRDCDLRAMV